MLFSLLKQSTKTMTGGGKNKNNFITLIIYFLITLFINSLLVNLTYNNVMPKISPNSSPLGYWDSVMLVILVMALFH